MDSTAVSASMSDSAFAWWSDGAGDFDSPGPCNRDVCSINMEHGATAAEPLSPPQPRRCYIKEHNMRWLWFSSELHPLIDRQDTAGGNGE